MVHPAGVAEGEEKIVRASLNNMLSCKQRNARDTSGINLAPPARDGGGGAAFT